MIETITPNYKTTPASIAIKFDHKYHFAVFPYTTTLPPPPPPLVFHLHGHLQGMSFNLLERQCLGIHGLLPPAFETEEQQVYRVICQIREQNDDLQKYVILDNLQVYSGVVCRNLLSFLLLKRWKIRSTEFIHLNFSSI